MRRGKEEGGMVAGAKQSNPSCRSKSEEEEEDGVAATVASEKEEEEEEGQN